MSASSLSTSSASPRFHTFPASRVLVRLLVGHRSEKIPPTPSGHTHRWTVYVKPPGNMEFADRSFIKKVIFVLHESFENPRRVIKDPPFKVTETGYGGFTMPIQIHFNGVSKAFVINYELSLSLEQFSEDSIEHKIELKNPPKELVELVAKYCPKKKDREAIEKPFSKPIIAEKRPVKQETKAFSKNEHKSFSEQLSFKVTISASTAHKTHKLNEEKKSEPSKRKSDFDEGSTKIKKEKASQPLLPPDAKFKEDTKPNVTTMTTSNDTKSSKVTEMAKNKTIRAEKPSEEENRTKEKERSKKKKKDKDKDRERDEARREKHKHRDKDKTKHKHEADSVKELSEKKIFEPTLAPNKIKTKHDEELSLNESSSKDTADVSQQQQYKKFLHNKTEPNSPTRLSVDNSRAIRPHSSMAINTSCTLAPHRDKMDSLSPAPLCSAPGTPMSPEMYTSTMMGYPDGEDSQWSNGGSKQDVTPLNNCEPVAEEPNLSDSEERKRHENRLQNLMEKLHNIEDTELLYRCADTLIEHDSSVINIDNNLMDFDLCQVKMETVLKLEQVFASFNHTSKR